MRKTFFNKINQIASKDKNVYLLTANLGFRLFDQFRQQLPNQFIDVGVAEANMIGIASGLSLSGKNTYCYSIIPFLIMRAYEQIRMDVGYHNLGVKLVGVGGGFTYGFEGLTHFGLEDISLMRSVPNMNVIVPSDIEEAKLVADFSYKFNKPLYIRLGRMGDPVIYPKPPDFCFGKGIVLEEGKDIAIIATGNILYQAKQVLDNLKKKGISSTLIDMHTVKPIDLGLINNCSREHEAIFTLEEHSINGGLGSAVAEVLSENSYNGKFRRIGIPDKLESVIGKAQYLRKYYSLDSDSITNTIMNTIGEKGEK